MTDSMIAWLVLRFIVLTLLITVFGSVFLFWDTANGVDLHDAIVAIFQGWAT